MSHDRHHRTPSQAAVTSKLPVGWRNTLRWLGYPLPLVGMLMVPVGGGLLTNEHWVWGLVVLFFVVPTCMVTGLLVHQDPHPKAPQAVTTPVQASGWSRAPTSSQPLESDGGGTDRVETSQDLTSTHRTP